MMNTTQAIQLIEQYKVELAVRCVPAIKCIERFNGFLVALHQLDIITSKQMGSIYTAYHQQLFQAQSTEQLIADFKIYLSHDRYNRDKITMMEGFLRALQQQQQIDVWQSYQVLEQYKQEQGV